MNNAPESLQSVFDRTFAGIRQAREAFTPHLMLHEVGTITSVSTGIARVSGLPSAGFEELLKFPGGVFGIEFNVDETEIGVVLLGDQLLGRVIDALGRPLDDHGPIAAGERLPIERPAPAIMDRAAVTVPLQTG